MVNGAAVFVIFEAHHQHSCITTITLCDVEFEEMQRGQ